MTKMLNDVNFNDYLRLTKKQREYIRIKSETDLSDKEIAAEINIHQPSISRWKTNDKFRAGLMAYQAHHLESSVPEALKTMVGLLSARSELVRFQAAKDILDRSGYTPIDKQELEVTTPTIINNIPLED
ncbi:DNA-binding protein [Staphylococcus hominis]|uniref:DNA-binding protein n=1 Tax=Staphylococcus hominis TaxID=1290 RepID=UPI001F595498|nr:DNA-binding protein [Staphylococcus hominis]MCI2898653.1 DNA-binding protein [Staphylococcus hominis]